MDASLCASRLRRAFSAASSGTIRSTDPAAAVAPSDFKRSRREIDIDRPSERSSSISRLYRFPFFACSSRYSDALQERAKMERVGFLSGLVTKAAASVTNKFFTSCAWQYLFRAELLASSPMRTVPDS